MRVKAVEVMKENLRLMEQKKYDEVQKNIEKVETQLNSYKHADKSGKLNLMK